VGMVRLHGGLRFKERQRIIDRFHQDPDCRVFISTDAGGLGLNLQAADVVINVDLPWNPAKLEQRIGRAHRIGQRKAVNVINLVMENTIEERVLEIIYQKQQLFAAMFDTDIDEINLAARSRVEEMQQLVASLLGEGTGG
jgi:SNF2 family DNA or RNA helicase